VGEKFAVSILTLVASSAQITTSSQLAREAYGCSMSGVGSNQSNTIRSHYALGQIIEFHLTCS
jgi:hypothetical protein